MASLPHSQVRNHRPAPAAIPFPATIPLRRPSDSLAWRVEAGEEARDVGRNRVRMRRVLVTGASGFLGSHLVEALLQRNLEVRAAVRSEGPPGLMESPGVERVVVDWNDDASLRAAVQGVDAVFHLAAVLTSVSSQELFEINVGLTERLARACAALETPPTFLYCSSIAAAGPSPRGEIRTERQAPAPISDYGRSKRGGELVLERMAARLPATIVRPGIVVGKRNRDLLPVFQSISRFRLHFVPGIQPPPLTFAHASDVCEIMLRAAERGERLPADSAAGLRGRGVYNAGGRETPNWGQLGRMVGESLGVGSPLILHLAEPFSWMIGWAGEMAAHVQGIPPAISRDKIREALVGSWATSSEKAARELGVFPAAPLEAHLAELADFYREKGLI